MKPQLDQITIYPIKSCSGINLQQAHVEVRGFPLDRRWMLIETDGHFISQRTTPQMGQIQIQIVDNQLIANYLDHDSLTFDVNTHSLEQVQSHIWKDSLPSYLVSKAVSNWFSKILGRPVHLVFMDQDIARPLVKEQLPNDQAFEVSFADGYPYLLTNQASLDDLNERLEQPINMDRFRSNLVVNGFEAFAEDHWKHIRIGDVDFMVVKPCARCQITRINQKTGISSKEPLKTLATYRKQGRQVMFGMNLVALNQGIIEVNQPVRILE